MTGYAVATRETPHGTLTIEITSVNSRFLDLQFRINDDLRASRTGVARSHHGTRHARQGRVPAELRPQGGGRRRRGQHGAAGPAGGAAGADPGRASRRPPRCRWPNCCAGPAWSRKPPVGQDTCRPTSRAAAAEALAAFVDSRQREGAALEAMLLARIGRHGAHRQPHHAHRAAGGRPVPAKGHRAHAGERWAWRCGPPTAARSRCCRSRKRSSASARK